MADIFEAIFQTVTTFPFNVIIFGAIIGYIIYYLYSLSTKKESQFQIEDFRESVYLGVRKLLETFGTRTNASLVRGIEPLGKIYRYYHLKGKLNPGFPDEFKSKKKLDEKDVDLWIFQIGASGIIQKVFGGHIDFLIIQNDHLQEFNPNKNQFSVKETVGFTPYGNVFLTGTDGEIFVNDISFRRSQEEIFTHLQNYPRKVAYLELAQAKILEKIKAEIEEKKSGYEYYKKGVLASGKDIEEDTDED